RISDILPLLHRELARRTGDSVVATLDRDVAGEASRQPLCLDVNLIAETERHARHYLEALRGVLRFASYDHLVRGGAYGARQIARLDFGLRHLHAARHIDPMAVYGKLEVGRRIDLRLGVIHDAQVGPLQSEFSARQRVVP